MVVNSYTISVNVTVPKAALAAGIPNVAKPRRRFPVAPPAPTTRADGRHARRRHRRRDRRRLTGSGGRRRGGAEQLKYLAEHPDVEVCHVLVEVLESYRGRTARILRERVIATL